jgi:hypothetical protein
MILTPLSLSQLLINDGVPVTGGNGNSALLVTLISSPVTFYRHFRLPPPSLNYQ